MANPEHGVFCPTPQKVYSGRTARNAPNVRRSLHSHMGLKLQGIHSFEPQTLHGVLRGAAGLPAETLGLPWLM